MKSITTWGTILMCGALMTGSGCSLFQPQSTVTRQYNFVDYDSAALRLARPVEAELLEKDTTGAWVNIGRGEIPAGAYVKGRAPQPTITAEVTEP